MLNKTLLIISVRCRLKRPVKTVFNKRRPWDNDHQLISAVYAAAFPMKMWSAHHFRVGVGNLTFLFIYFIRHTCFQSAETQHSWVFPLLQCHYKTMFIVCGICSNFTALAPFCTRCLVLLWTGYGIWDSFHAVLFKDVIVGPCTGHSQPLGLFPKR